jgi:lipoprotein-anchoring transpeptidase ErfK/SrfK
MIYNVFGKPKCNSNPNFKKEVKRMILRLFLLILPLFLLISTNNSAQVYAEQVNTVVQFTNQGDEGVYLVINKAKNTLSVYLNGYIIYDFPIATGKDKDLTPEGRFRISNKVKNPWYIPKEIPGGSPENPLGSMWMGLNVPKTNGYKYGIHGTNDPSSIGLSVSQGCIRMQNKDVEWLARHIPLKTDVFIIDEDEHP